MGLVLAHAQVKSAHTMRLTYVGRLMRMRTRTMRKLQLHAKRMSEFSDVSSSATSEASDSEESLPGGAPRISSGALLEGGEEEELRSTLNYCTDCPLSYKFPLAGKRRES